jgi:hypothetical protein
VSFYENIGNRIILRFARLDFGKGRNVPSEKESRFPTILIWPPSGVLDRAPAPIRRRPLDAP